jgi:hypothetical protein
MNLALSRRDRDRLMGLLLYTRSTNCLQHTQIYGEPLAVLS